MSESSLIHGFSDDFKTEEIIKKMRKGDESFYLCNLSDVAKKFDDWIEKIPRVKPFYAVS
jgi:hypothetical protein